VSERDFTRQVIDLARLLGWHVMHQRPARNARGWVTAVSGHVGFVDLVLCRHRVVFAELKIPPNGLTEAQAGWVEALRAAGATVEVWTPTDWPRIEAVLKGEV